MNTRRQLFSRGRTAYSSDSRRVVAHDDQSSIIFHLSSERGFSLVSAIFLLVVIAALGTFAVTLSTTQQQSAALDVMGARAYQAARAGIEWGAYQVLTPGAINCGTLAAPQSNTVTLTGSTLQNFLVTVNCGNVAASEASATVTMYQLVSTAKQGTPATPDYVERQISVTIAK